MLLLNKTVPHVNNNAKNVRLTQPQLFHRKKLSNVTDKWIACIISIDNHVNQLYIEIMQIIH